MLKLDRFPKKYLEDIGEIYTFVTVKLSHQSKTIVTMKGTIKEMIYFINLFLIPIHFSIRLPFTA